MVKYMVLERGEVPPFISKENKKEIKSAIKILREAGAKEIYLFGSMTSGSTLEHNDIDIGVRGLNPGIFFSTYGKLASRLEKPVDLVDFDTQKDFFEMLISVDEVVQIG